MEKPLVTCFIGSLQASERYEDGSFNGLTTMGLLSSSYVCSTFCGVCMLDTGGVEIFY